MKEAVKKTLDIESECELVEVSKVLRLVTGNDIFFMTEVKNILHITLVKDVPGADES